jgi:hypothetical protein
MVAMALLQTGETTIGPLAFDGRTITLVARTTALHVGDDGRGALAIRSRPRHVEVLDEDGRREVLPVRDVEGTFLVAIAIAAVAATCVVRALRTRE